MYQAAETLLSHICKHSEEIWQIKLAPYSFTIARALMTKAQVICARSKRKHHCFSIFMTSTWAQKANLTENFLAFPFVNFKFLKLGIS